MATDARSLLCLPPEILTNILALDILQDVDVCRMSQVCGTLHEICWSNDIWREKFRQRWPSTAKINLCLPQGGWFEFYKLRRSISERVQQCLKDLAARNYHRDEVSDEEFCPFLKLQETHQLGPHLVMEDLHAILDTDRHCRLTDKYYARKALSFLHQRCLKEELTAFLSLPVEEQFLEKGAHLASSWWQPTKQMTLADLTRQLDDVADRVRVRLRHETPDHPACFKDNSITGFTENLWSLDQCRLVLEAINYVLYKDLSFHPNAKDYYNPQNSFIEEVLQSKNGIPITLCIIYSAVARRLGVVCEPVNFPSHFLLKWKEHPMAVGLDQFTFINAYNSGKFMTPKQCLGDLLNASDVELDSDLFQAATPAKVLERMARNIVGISRSFGRGENHMQLLRSGLALYLVISPDDDVMRMLQVRVFLHLSINLRDVLESLQTLPYGGGALMHECETKMRNEQAEESKQPAKLRADYPEVEFSVGMVMKHKRYGYMCVIYGWDHECMASEEWIDRMGVNNLPQKQHQPFYNVLVEDGSNRYAAQENLLYTRSLDTISHTEVEKFFEEFTGRYYIPNPQKQAEYPEDMEVTQTLIDNYFASGE